MTEREIFLQAIEFDMPDARVAFLDRVCRHDATLRRKVDELLREHFATDDLLTGPAFLREAVLEIASPAAETPRLTISRYKLLEKIGEGGFGEVWMAEQREPVKRRVALKILKPGMDSRQVIARFEAERQALALMDHPNIAKILDAGMVGPGDVEGSGAPAILPMGRPYFVMELVRGTKITEYCDRHQLPTRDRLHLFILVCRAVQHAHQKGIIHRDLKPSNILVTLNDGAPFPKVIDFGIAKATQQELTDKTLFTQFHQFIGTPAYISPEQADLGSLDIDTRSDIYSLGVLLYEMLVGETPFDAQDMLRGGIDVLRRILRERDPLTPSTRLKNLPETQRTATALRHQTDPVKLTHVLRGDLDWIVMKCLEKNRTRRYETANGLAADIERFLADEPVVARPPSTAYRLQKTLRRHRLAFTAAAMGLVFLVLGAATVIVIQHRANRAYRQQLYVSDVNRAGLAWQAGHAAQMATLLDRCPPDLRHWEWDFLQQQTGRWTETTLLVTPNLVGIALSADERLLAVAAGDTIQVREFPGGQWVCAIPFAAAPDAPFTLSPRDEFLATLAGPEGILHLWNRRTGERLAEMKHGSRAEALAWSADGEWLASGGHDGRIRFWDPRTGRERFNFEVPMPVVRLAFSPDGGSLAVGLMNHDARLLAIPSGAMIRGFQAQRRTVHRLAFSPDGRWLATANLTMGGFGRDNRVWGLHPDAGSLDLDTVADAVAFDFTHDAQLVGVADNTGIIRLWDLERRSESDRFSAHVGAAHSVRFLADGRILSAGSDGAVRIWRREGSGVTQLKGYPHALRTVAFSTDGRWLAAAGIRSQVFLWDSREGYLPWVYTNHIGSAAAVAFSPDGRVATASADRMVHLWDPATQGTLWTHSLAPAASAWWLAFSPDGRRLYAASSTKTVTVLDAATGETLQAIGDLGDLVDGLAVSPNGQLLAIGQKTELRVWLADRSRELWRVSANPYRCVTFSPDGRWIATGDEDGAISLWEVAAAGRVQRRLTGHSATVSGVSFSPDGRRLVSCGFDGQVKVWDWKAGSELLTLPLPAGGQAWHVVFSPDGKTIAAAGGDGIVTLWTVK